MKYSFSFISIKLVNFDHLFLSIESFCVLKIKFLHNSFIIKYFWYFSLAISFYIAANYT